MLDPDRAERSPFERSPFERLFTVAASVSAAQLLWVLVMGLIAGGQLVADQWPDWDPLVPWPVLAIPSWCTIALGALACAGAVGAAAGRHGRTDAAPHAARSRAGRAVQDIGIALVVLVVLPLGLARLYPEPGGVSAPFAGPDGVLGWHWIAAALQAITVAALLLRAVRAARSARPLAPR
ncbi:hypothetical protein LG314_12995 [Agrococcus terreus]|uniref:hypothetical protein n=1 Tax=Agrococcus terreus TaxID=574649 RepID=UPI00384BF670